MENILLYKTKIDILLSTYNGGNYLDCLIKSLINQTYQNWNLIVRDDGSSDNSIDIIQNYKEEYPTKVSIINDDLQRLGPSKSFSKLMDYSNAKYIMFCDQDDIWADNKIELCLMKMHTLEGCYPKKPLLVHTDLTVVDDQLSIISKSFWSYQNINPQKRGLNFQLVQNSVTGCTVMINEKLKNLAYPIPQEAIMHDWWLALIASLYGENHHLDKSTILYRQHEKNSIGAKEYSLLSLLKDYKKFNYTIRNSIKQADALYSRYRNSINKKQLNLLKDYVYILKKNRINRLLTIYKNKYRKHGFLRNIGFIVMIFCMKKEKME